MEHRSSSLENSRMQVQKKYAIRIIDLGAGPLSPESPFFGPVSSELDCVRGLDSTAKDHSQSAFRMYYRQPGSCTISGKVRLGDKPGVAQF
jgi:hypothetical protein